MDNKSTTKRMIGAVVLVLIAALLLAWLLKGKNRGMEEKNLISEQTQEATPILGFPGVKDGQEQLASQGATQEAGADQNTVIGAANPDAAAQQEAQNALNGQVQGAADAATGGVSAVAGAVTGAVGSVVEAGKEAVQGLASQTQSDTTGFQVRDPNGEVRQVVDGGKVEAGVGSMGADVKTAEQVAADTGAATAAQGKTTTASSASKNDAAGQQQASENDNAGKIVNPRLVNEKPVPVPTNRSQAVAAASASSSASAGASSSGAAASGADASGYVIQVLATSSKGKADGVKKSIAVDGYPAFIAQAKVDGKTVYRVRIGTYPGKGDASAVQARMKARYSQNQYVQNSFVTKN